MKNKSANLYESTDLEINQMSWNKPEAKQYHETIKQKIPAYSTLYQLTGYMLDAVMETVEPNQDGLRRIAVIGAGGGQEMVVWGTDYSHWHVIGVDPSKQMIDTALKRVNAHGLQNRCHLIEGTIDELPPASGICEQYDGAVCLLVLHFIKDGYEHQNILSQLVSSVKPGAPVLVACITAEEDNEAVQQQMEAWRRHMLGHKIAESHWQRFADSFHSTTYPVQAAELEYRLRQAGLEQVHCYFQTLLIRAYCGRRPAEKEKGSK